MPGEARAKDTRTLRVKRKKELEDLIEHKQTAILDPASNMMIEVDEGIAPLLQIIGLNASQSCSIMLSISIRFPMEDYGKLRDILEEKSPLIN